MRYLALLLLLVPLAVWAQSSRTQLLSDSSVDSANITDATIVAADLAADIVVTTTGTLSGKAIAASAASGSIVVNSITLATADAQFDIPDGACNAAGDIGNWVTIVLEDASVSIEITSLDASNIITVPGLGLGAGDELDSVSHTVTEGQNITLTCLTADNWYMTGGSVLHSDGTIAWADGGAT